MVFGLKSLVKFVGEMMVLLLSFFLVVRNCLNLV